MGLTDIGLAIYPKFLTFQRNSPFKERFMNLLTLLGLDTYFIIDNG